MPRIGNVEVSDEVIRALGSAPAPARPGIGAVFGAAAQGTIGQLRYGVPLAAEKLLGTLGPNDDAYYKRGLEESRAAAATAAPAQVSDLTSGRVGLGRFIAENIAASAPQMVGTIAGSVAGGVLAGPEGAIAGGVAAGTPMFVGSNVDRAVQETGDLTTGGAIRSVLAAPVQAASDVLGERYLPGVGKLFGGFAARQTGGFLARTAKSIAKAGATEAVTEAGQQVAERFAAGLPVGGPEAAGEYVNAAVTAFAVGGVLGAGGGFRRTAAHVKPAADVTTDDLGSAVDAILSPKPAITPIANPSYQPPRLALPSPEAFQQPIAVGADGTAVTPEQRAAGLDPSVLEQPPIDEDGIAARLEQARQLAVANFEAGDAPRRRIDAVRDLLKGGTPDTGIPDALRATPSDFDPQAAIDRMGSTSQRAIDAATIGGFNGLANQVEVSPRLFPTEPIADLNAAVRAKNASPELKAEAQREIEARRKEAAGDAPLTTENFSTRLDELRDGIRNSFVKKLTAANPDELVRKVYDEVFDNQNTSSGVAKLAQRIGLLDDKLEPTEKANAIEASRTAQAQADATPAPAREGTPVAAAPAVAPEPAALEDKRPDVGPRVREAVSITAPTTVDPEFQQSWARTKAEVGIQKDTGVLKEIGTPANQADAEARVMRALANDSVVSTKGASPVEKLAQKMGLISPDDAMEVTPAGRKAFLNTSEGLEETVNAATAQGYTGAQASIFDRGARELLNGAATSTHTSFEDMAAYQAGRIWAQDFIDKPITKPLTQNAETRMAKRELGRERPAVERPQLTPTQIKQQAHSNLLDGADLRSVPDTEVAALRRMALNPDVTDLEMGQAIERAQGGKLSFVQPETTPTATTPVGRQQGAGQPVFKEMNPALQGRARSAPTRGEARALRAEMAPAVRAYNVRNDIDFAVENGLFGDRRAQQLHDMVDKGDVTGAERMLAIITKAKELQGRAAEDADLDRILNSPVREEPVVYGQPKQFEPLPPGGPVMTRAVPGALLNDRQMAEYRKRYWAEKQRQDAAAKGSPFAGSSLGTKDAKLEQALTGKSFDAALQHLIDNASSKYHREIASRIAGLAKEISKAGGHQFGFEVVRPGDLVPTRLNNPRVRALTTFSGVPARTTVWLKSVEMGDEHGVNEQLALHEMLHAVTMRAIDFGLLVKNQDTAIGKAVKDLFDLRNAIVEHFNARARAGTMTDFERAAYNGANSFRDVHEILAWGLTNPDMQEYLNGIEYKPKQSVFSRLVELVRNLLGLDANKDSALEELMRVSENILGTGARDLAPVFDRSSPEGGRMAPLHEALEADAGNRTVTAANDAVKGVADLTERVVSHINPQDLGVKARRIALGWISRNQIDRQYGARMPGLISLSDGLRAKDAVRGRFASMGDQVYQNYEKLEREAPERAKQLVQLMATSTQFKLDPDKAWEDHTHLEKEPNLAALRKLHGDVVKMKNDLSRGDGAGYRLFQEIRASNDLQNYARLTSELHALVALDPEFKLGVAGAGVNPMDVFMTQSDLSEPAAIRDWWQKALMTQIGNVTTFLNQKKGEAAVGTASDQRATKQHLSYIEEKVAATYEALAGMQRAPYFHLGRFGDNFGSAVIKKTEAGTVDPAAQRAVAEALEKAGFRNAELSADNTRPRFSLRFETVDQTRAFEKLAKQLEADGHLEPDTIKSGPRTRADNFGVADTTPGYVQRYIAELKNDPRWTPEPGMTKEEIADLNKRRDEMVTLAMDTWIASQPDSAISKVLTARHTVPGFDPDMMRNYAHRWNVGSTSLASVATSARISQAYIDMRAQATEATEASNPDDPQLLADLLTESKKRDAVNPADNSDGKYLDKLRAFGHAYFLGFSPAYAAIQIMQVGTNGIPELAKSHGYGKSFHAIRRATPKALAVLRAAAAEARAQGVAHAADLTLTENVLKGAGLSEKETAFLRSMIATGSIDIGSSAHALGQIAKGQSGGKVAIGLKYASAFGLYTEAASRLMTALAAHDLHGGDVGESAKYAQNVVSNSMFDYQNWNRARQLGKQGFAGPVTPLLTQFMTYSAQMTEKLVSEVHGAIGAQRVGETAESAAQRRAASRTFLLGHLTAITALAGTLGLPFASVFATALERSVDALDGDDEPFDATASWRNFLAGIFGKDVAEVVSRGLPRAIGFDISQRVGESDLLPFSQLIGDRRSWKESIASTLGRSSGASVDMLVNIADGGQQMIHGDVLAGMKAMLPVAFKGPAEAYRMSTDGYIDTKGNKLPMSPGALSIMWQLLGFSPAEKAEYGEARQDQAGRRIQITQQGGRLRQQIVGAMVRGDMEKAQSLIADAQEFDRANPAFAVIPSLAGALQRRQQSAARSRALGAPLGVTPDDVAGRALTGYANVNYR